MDHTEYLQLLKRREELEHQISNMDTKQQAIKTMLNSCYGAFSNKFCPVGDQDIATSITMTGQAVIKESSRLYKQFITDKTGITDAKALDRGLIYNDTDSLMISLNDIMPEISEGGKVKPEAYELIEEFGTYLNNGIKKWAKNTLNSLHCTLEFKREIISDRSIFLAKKNYVMHVLDKEGFKCDSWKYTGVEIVKTTMPNDIKPYVKDIIHKLVLSGSEKETNDLLIKAYNHFKTLSIDKVAIPSGINNYKKYASECNEFETKKGMPKHVKAAYFYNILLEKLSISDKYEEINSGDKIKLIEIVKPNKYNIPVIAYKNRYPVEFNNIFKLNTETMFEKCMFKCIERFYSAMGWIPRKPNEMFFDDLDDFFN